MTSHDRLFADMMTSMSTRIDGWIACGLTPAAALARVLAASCADSKVRAALTAKYGA